MQEVEIELGIGDVVQIGDNYYTVIDIDAGEVVFRVDCVEPADMIAAPPSPAR